MKYYKHLAMLLFAALFAFLFISCDNSPGSSDDSKGVKATLSELFRTGNELYYVATSSFGQGKGPVTVKSHFPYGYQGDRIISHYIEEEFADEAYAREAFEGAYKEMDDSHLYESVRRDGKRVIIVYAPAEHADMTVASVEEKYQAMKAALEAK